MKKIMVAVSLCVFTSLSISPAAPLPETGNYPFLDAIPANSPMVVHIKGVEGVTNRVNEFLKNALPDLAPMTSKEIERQFSTLLEGRKLASVAKDGPHYFAYLEFPQNPGAGFNPDQAQAMAAIRVTNYEKFRDEVLKEEERKTLKLVEPGVEAITLGANEYLYFISRKEQVLLTPSKEIALKLAKKPQGIAGKISNNQLARLHGSDLGVFFNLDTLNKDYAKMIEQGKKDIDQAVGQMELILPKEQQNSIGMIRQVVAGAFQALQDSKGFVAGLEFRPTGLVGHANLELRAKSATASLLEGGKGNAFFPLGSLPAGHGFYSAQQINIPLMKQLVSLSMGAMPGDAGKEFSKVVQALLDNQTGNQYGGMSLPPAGIQIVESDNPKATLDAYKKFFSQMGKMSQFQGGVLKGAPVIKEGSQKYKGVSFDQIQIEYDLEKMLAQTNQPNIPMELGQFQKALMGKLIGEKMNVWIGAGEKRVEVIYGKDWDSAVKNLEHLEKGEKVGDNPLFQSARRDLPKEAAFIIMADPMSYIRLMVDAVKEMGNALPIPAQAIPNLAGAKTTFSGVAISLEGPVSAPATQGAQAGVDGVISSASIKEIYEKLIKPIIGPLIGG